MNRVASERKMKNLTQIQLAEEVHVSESTVVRWEKGGSIPQEKLIAMRLLFNCDLDWLLGLSNNRRVVTLKGKECE